MKPSQASAVAQRLLGQVASIRTLREVNTPGWQRLHQAADLNQPSLEAHVQKAFTKALGSLGTIPTDEVALEEHMSAVMEVFEKTLHHGLEDLLLNTLGAGGDAAAMTLMRSPLMRTSQGYYKPTLVMLRSHLDTWLRSTELTWEANNG
jgi:hypothetical protein